MNFKLHHDIIIIDLELNQPSQKIIEIGAVRFLRDGGIHPQKFDIIVNPNEQLGKCKTRERGVITISELTGITQEMVNNGTTLQNAIEKMKDWAYSESKNFVLAGWGGDPFWLHEQCLQNNIIYPFRRKSFDIKSMVVFASALMGKKIKTDGLKNMMKCFQLSFQGSQHRADSDAYNTAKLLQKCVQEYNQYINMIVNGVNGLNRNKK